MAFGMRLANSGFSSKRRADAFDRSPLLILGRRHAELIAPWFFLAQDQLALTEEEWELVRRFQEAFPDLMLPIARTS